MKAPALMGSLSSQFFARTDVVAAQHPETKKPWPVHVDDLEALLVAHVEGERAPMAAYRFAGEREVRKGRFRIGSYVFREDGQVTFACFDLDGGPGHKHPLADATRTMILMVGGLRSAGFVVHAERSASAEGWHIWVFFDDPLPAREVRAALRRFVPDDAHLVDGALANVDRSEGIELFPKADKLKPNKKGGLTLGNLVWAPHWAAARPGGNRFYEVVNGSVGTVIDSPVLTMTPASLVANSRLPVATTRDQHVLAHDAKDPERSTSEGDEWLIARSPTLTPAWVPPSARVQWTHADYGEAMVAAARSQTSSIRERVDGIEHNAFWAAGRDGLKVRIWRSKGTWHDIKTGESGGAKAYAAKLGLSLKTFMDRYGSRLAPVSPPPPVVLRPLFPPEDAAAAWEAIVNVAEGPCGGCLACWDDEACPTRGRHAARTWLMDVRGLTTPDPIDSGATILNAETAKAVGTRGAWWLRDQVERNGEGLLVPLRDAGSNAIAGLAFRPFKPSDPAKKSVFAPGLKLTASGIPLAYGFAGAVGRAECVVVVEGLVDTLVAEACFRPNPTVVAIGVPSVSQFPAWGDHLIAARPSRVIVVPHLDGNDLSPDGTGQDASALLLSRLRAAGIHADFFKWGRVLAALDARGVPDVEGAVRDLGDVAKAGADAAMDWPQVQQLVRLGAGV